MQAVQQEERHIRVFSCACTRTGTCIYLKALISEARVIISSTVLGNIQLRFLPWSHLCRFDYGPFASEVFAEQGELNRTCRGAVPFLDFVYM